MASVNWKRRGKRYLVYWRLDDGTQGGKTVDTKDEAEVLKAEMRVKLARGTLTGIQKGKRPFSQWGDEWWESWSSNPDLSPATLDAQRRQYRKHVRPFFARHQVRAISPAMIHRWQHKLAAETGYRTVMACRSILRRILQYAEDEGAIDLNPMSRVRAPKKRTDPAVLLGEAKRRAPTPEEAGILLAHFPDFWWDHVISLLGTGLRFGEFAGLRRRRVRAERGTLQVVETRYQAGAFGSGFKPRPKSESSIREIPLAAQVGEAIMRRLPPGSDPEDLVFTGPGGGPGQRNALDSALGPGVKRGTRTVLSRHNFRRVYRQSIERARKNAQRPGLAHLSLDHLALRGPHDLRHAFSTWLEEEGIPIREIDRLMGHSSSRRPDGGAPVGRVYRETTPELTARVLRALEKRLAIVLEVAERTRAQVAAARTQAPTHSHDPAA